jgi:hypothetical protein
MVNAATDRTPCDARGPTSRKRVASLACRVRPDRLRALTLPFRALALVSLALLTAGTSSGCRGWQGDMFLRHRAPAKRARQEATYQFGRPGDRWRPVRKVEDVQVAWLDPGRGAVIEIHAQCDDQGDSSLQQYTDHLRMDMTDWKVVDQHEEKLLGRAALRTVVDAQLDGVPMRHEFVVLKKNGCLFDLSYSAAPRSFADGQPDFHRVVAGFRFPVSEAGGG